MTELINLLKEKAQLTDEQAQRAAEAIGSYIKSKMPAALHNEIDQILQGKKLGEASKQKLNDAAADLRDRAEEMLNDVREKLSGMFGNTEEKK
jgi:ElaB/YqjD/DUF883 family membrane-anchored ribosome-binding protein